MAGGWHDGLWYGDPDVVPPVVPVAGVAAVDEEANVAATQRSQALTVAPTGTPARRFARRLGPADLTARSERDLGRAAADGSPPPVLVLDDVSKTFANGRSALRDVDLAVPEGDFVFLVGPSGAGKSTLLRLIVRDELATAGRVLLDGEDVARIDRRRVPLIRRKLGVVFQDYKLLPSMSVRENVAFALEVTGTPRRRIRPAVDRVLAIVGLSDIDDSPPSQLSGGEQQRTAIARALVHDPRLIIADEPTGNLDPLISWEIIQLLLRINELGVTVLVATHQAEVVTALRRRVVALESGRIVRDELAAAYHRET